MALIVGQAGIAPEQTEHLKTAIDLRSSSARSGAPATRPPLRVIPVLLPGVKRPSPEKLPRAGSDPVGRVLQDSRRPPSLADPGRGR